MQPREWSLTDNSTYCKSKEKIDALILSALANGPLRSYDLMAILRAEGYGNAKNDGPLELSYSMTGAIYRSAQNSLRERGLIYDAYDAYLHTGVKRDFAQIYRRDLTAADLAPMQEATNG